MKARIIISLIVLIAAFTSCMAQDVTTTTHYNFKRGISLDSILEVTPGAGVKVEGITIEDDSLKWSLAGIYHAGGYLDFFLATVYTYRMTNLAFWPWVTDTTDLGKSDRYFDELYINKSYFGDGSTSISNVTNSLTLTDVAEGSNSLSDIMDWVDTAAVHIPLINANSDKVTNATHTSEVTGTTALTIANNIINEANLEATNSPTDNYILSYNAAGTNFTWIVDGGSVGGDTMVVDSVAHMLSDTLCFPFGLGARLSTDTMLMHDDSYMGGWTNEQDTCVALKAIYEAYGTSASIPFRIVYGDSVEVSSPTVILSATATTTLTSTTTFTNNKIPRDKKIWCEINGEPSTSGNMILVDFEHAYTRY